MQSGRRDIISSNNTAFLADIFVRADRANDGLTRQASVSTLQELDPNLTRIQAQL